MASYLFVLLSVISFSIFGATAQIIAYTNPISGGTFGQVLPDISLSPFANSLYNALTTRDVFSRLFDVSFSPSSASSDFYSASQSFAQMLGVSDPGVLPQRVSDSAALFVNGISPQRYFKAVANTIDNFLKGAGKLNAYNQEQLIQSYASYLQEAATSSSLFGPQAGLDALSRGTVNFLNSLGQFTPDQVTSLISTYVDEIYRA